MFNEAFDNLDRKAQLFLKAVISRIRELIRKYGKTRFEKNCNKLLKKPKSIIQWLNDNENILQPTDKDCLARQYLMFTILHDGFIDKAAILPIYFTDIKINQNEETTQIYRAIDLKYYAAFKDTERLKTEAYITDALKAIETDLSKQPTDKVKNVRHSADFRSVVWFGTKYSFTGNQAAAVKILWDDWENGTPDVSGDYIATEISSDSKRPKDIFKNNPAFGSMIQQGKTKGTLRLVEPKK